MRLCSTCRTYRPDEEFCKYAKSSDGIHYRCRACNSNSSRRSIQSNRARNANPGVSVSPRPCTKCMAVKPSSCFSKLSSSKDGLNTVCKDCRNLYERTLWQKHNPLVGWGTPEYKLVSQEKLKAYRKKYRRINKEILREKYREYVKSLAQSQWEKRKKRMADDPLYAKKVKQQRKNVWMRYNGRKRAGGDYTTEQWLGVLSRAGGKCLRCGTSENIQRDHVNPIRHGGSNYINNIQPLCKPCNVSKHAKFIDYRHWTMDSDEIGLDAA